MEPTRPNSRPQGVPGTLYPERPREAATLLDNPDAHQTPLRVRRLNGLWLVEEKTGVSDLSWHFRLRCSKQQMAEQFLKHLLNGSARYVRWPDAIEPKATV